MNLVRLTWTTAKRRAEIHAKNVETDLQHILWHENREKRKRKGRGLMEIHSVAVSDLRTTANQWENLTLVSASDSDMMGEGMPPDGNHHGVVNPMPIRRQHLHEGNSPMEVLERKRSGK